MGGSLSNNSKTTRKKAESAFEDLKYDLGNDGIYLVGSCRREKTIVSDLDIVICVDEAASDIYARLKDYCGVDMTNRKSISILIEYEYQDKLEEIQLDLSLCNRSILGSYLLHWTGSMKENIRLRNKAKKFGWKLSQNGLVDNLGQVISLDKTEEEIYEMLDEAYVEPKRR